MKILYQAIYFSIGLAAAAAEPPTVTERDCQPTMVQRDLAAVTSVFASVGTGIGNLDAAVKKLSGSSDIAQLQSASSSLLSLIKSGTATVQGSSDLSLQDAVQLQQVVTGLQSASQALGDDLAAKKSLFESLGLCKIVQLQVTDIATASKALSDAVVAKVPQAAQQIAAQMANGFTSTVAQSQETFADSNCTNSASSSAPMGSTSSTNTTPSQSAGSAGNGTFVSAGATNNMAAAGFGVVGLLFALACM